MAQERRYFNVRQRTKFQDCAKMSVIVPTLQIFMAAWLSCWYFLSQRVKKQACEGLLELQENRWIDIYVILMSLRELTGGQNDRRVGRC